MTQIQVELQEFLGSDESVCNSAWTSTYDKSRRDVKYDDPQKVADLIQRLAKEQHSTPFESVVLRFWMRIPIFIDRQIMTHRIASHNGLSGRYRTMPEDFYALPADTIDIFKKVYTDSSYAMVKRDYYEILTEDYRWYKEQLDDCKSAKASGKITDKEYKRVREVLRGVLGTAFMTERTSLFNLRSFANFIRLRDSDHAQPEIRQVAQLMLKAVKTANVAPLAIKALEENGWRI